MQGKRNFTGIVILFYESSGLQYEALPERGSQSRKSLPPAYLAMLIIVLI